MAFDLDAFLDACRTARSRDDWPAAVAQVLRDAVGDPDAIEALVAARGVSARQGYDVWLQSPDLTIYQVRGVPGLLSPPHDHATVAVVAAYRGEEGYRNYRLDGGRLVETGRVVVRAPDVSILPADAIHALDNTQTAGSASIHVYGNGHFDVAERRLWNPETFEVAPYDTAQQFAWTKGARAAAQA